jgi:hypothetical protein
MSKRNWNVGIIQLFNDAIFNEGLSAETQGLTNGLRYHLIDICIDELAKVNRNAELPLTEATFLDCLEPFFGLAKMAVDKNVQKRVMQNVLLKFLNEYSFVSAAAALTEDEEAQGDDAEKEKASLIFNQVHVGTVSNFIFSIASDSDTDERYRKTLYEMHKAYARQIRLAGRDVDIDVHDSEDDEEKATNEGNDLCNLEEEMQDDYPEEDASDDKNTAVGEVSVSVKGDSETTDTPSEKKKSRKKKKKAEKDKSTEEDETAASETTKANDETCPDNTAPVSKSSSKKKKKKHRDNDCAMDVVTGVPETNKVDKTEDLTTDPSLTPESKSAKKKRKLQEGIEPTIENIPAHLITTHVETPAVNSSKKKKKQKSSPPSVDPRSMHSPDQVVINQNASFEEFGSSDDNDASFSPSKRVSFGKVNHSKSHKASMKAIQTLDKGRWDTATRTPDKGILRPKIGIMSSVKKGQSKKPPLGPLSSSKKQGKRG